MSRDLPRHAVDRLLEVGAPLSSAPDSAALDLDRYELGPELGRGGMGIVYEALDKELDRKVALKVLSSAAGMTAAGRQRFAREAKAAAKLSHPHIATVYDATPDVIAMQKIDGVTLAERPWRDERELVELVRDASLAIHYAHGEGVIHRDLKPANLMVERTDRPHVFVMDFGLAKERAVDSSLSASGSVVGTPTYMAPEQARGGRDDVGPWTDVYGLGATLYHCLAARPPFEGDDVYSVLRDVVEKEPAPLAQSAPAVDRDLTTIVAKCLRKETSERYATALALAGDLDRYLRDEPVTARPPSVVYRLKRFVSRRQGAIVASVAAALFALLLASPFLVWSREKRRAAEAQIELTERVFALSERVQRALSAARSAAASGGGYEESALVILADAAQECRAFLGVRDSPHVWFFLGQLLAAAGEGREARDAFDRAEAGNAGIEALPRERGILFAELFRDELPLLGEEPSAELNEWRERAARDLAQSLEADTNAALSVPGLYALGLLAWVTDDLEGAIGRLGTVVEMDFAHRGAHLALTKLFLLVDETELAMRHSIVATDLLRGATPAYKGGAGLVDPSDGAVTLDVLALPGIDELFVNFHTLLQREPGDAHLYGYRAQVQLRRAANAIEKSAWLEAWQRLETAVNELTAALGVAPEDSEVRVNRGATYALLDRVLSQAGEWTRAEEARAGALGDYDAAIRSEPDLAIAWFDRAVFRKRRAELPTAGAVPFAARIELARAREDAQEALRVAEERAPHRGRLADLARDLTHETP